MIPEHNQSNRADEELSPENISNLASQIEALNLELEALDKTPDAAKKAMKSIGEARDFLELLSGDADLDPSQALKQGEHALSALQENLQRLKNKGGGKEFTDVNLGEIEKMGNDICDRVTGDLVSKITKLNRPIGETIKNMVGEEDFSNKDTFLGKQLSAKYENMLKSIGVEVDSSLIAGVKKLVDRELADLKPINRTIKAIKEFIVARFLKVFS